MPIRIRRPSARTISAKLEAARSLMPSSLEIPADNRASRMAAASNADSTLSLAPSANCASASDLASPILPSAVRSLRCTTRQFDHLRDEDGPGHQRGKGKADHDRLDDDIRRQEHRPGRQFAQRRDRRLQRLGIVAFDRLRRRVRGRWRRCGLSGHGRRRNSRRLRGCGRRCGHNRRRLKLPRPAARREQPWAAAPERGRREQDQRKDCSTD